MYNLHIINMDESLKKIKKHPYPSWIDILSIIGVFVLISFLGNFILSISEKYISGSKGMLTAISYSTQFIVVIIFALVQKRIRAKGQKVFNFSLHIGSPSLLLWGVTLTIAVSTLVEPLLTIFNGRYFELISQMAQSGGWNILTCIVLAPIFEEVLFRGIIQSALSVRIGKWLALIVSSFIFGAVHIIPPQAINAFFVSLVLGYIFIRTGSLLSVIVIHSLNNAIAYLTLSHNGGEYVSLRQLITNQTTYMVVYGCCAALFLIALIKVISLIKTQKQKL